MVFLSRKFKLRAKSFLHAIRSIKALALPVQSAVRLLLKNDFITHEDGRYRVYDYFFSEWLAEVF